MYKLPSVSHSPIVLSVSLSPTNPRLSLLIAILPTGQSVNLPLPRMRLLPTSLRRCCCYCCWALSAASISRQLIKQPTTAVVAVSVCTVQGRERTKGFPSTYYTAAAAIQTTSMPSGTTGAAAAVVAFNPVGFDAAHQIVSHPFCHLSVHRFVSKFISFESS